MLLLMYGTNVGEEIQHIHKECHSCNGTGKFKSNWKPTETCWSCCGSGVYENYWTRLVKYKLGNYYFHNPINRQYTYEPLFEGKSLPVITGYIHHKAPKYRMGTEAMYWLFLIYDFKHFKKLFGMFGYKGNIRTPMVFFANISFHIRNDKWSIDIWTKEKGWIWNRKKDNHWEQHGTESYDTDNLPF